MIKETTLTKVGYGHRLLSYFFIRAHPINQFRRYVTKGIAKRRDNESTN
jgi:hypothetical protein